MAEYLHFDRQLLQTTGIAWLSTRVENFAEHLANHFRRKQGVQIEEDVRIHFKRRRSSKNNTEDFKDGYYAIADVMTLLTEAKRHAWGVTAPIRQRMLSSPTC